MTTDASMTYCVDGDDLAWIDVDVLDLERDLADMPGELHAAFDAAGTLDDLRRIPLLVTPFG
ncbi:hypothetical protein ACIG56_14350 [Nocardia fusca]|uniref:hypothetical protein n=1 Tax=Nocardia fusca TaxID=941183 RepID=UPI0037CB7AE9